jgi:transcriptional regulator with XRE-family HTH domain
MSERTGNEHFGQFLRRLRLEKGHGLRVFAEKVAMQPSNLSNIELGRLKPPQDPETLAKIAEALGLEPNSGEWNGLHELAVAHKEGALAPDLAAYAGKTPGIPVLLRTIADRRLVAEELEELRDYIESRYARGGDGSG